MKSQVLTEFGAPKALCDWLAQSENWAEPPREYRMWWAALCGEPIDTVLRVEFEVLGASIEALIGPHETEHWCSKMKVRDPDYELLARQIEERADAVTTGYRKARRENVLVGFTALAWLCRALGGVETARARRIGAREVRARELAALVGAGHSAFLRDDEGLRFDLSQAANPVNSELAYACSAVAEAWRGIQSIGAVA